MTKFALRPNTTYVEEGRLWYDTKKGVSEKIKTLDGLLHLVYERYQAGYVREEQLNELYILGGNYRLDSCGNCFRAEISVKGLFPKIPDVMSYQEFDNFISLNFDKKNGGIPFNSKSRIPTTIVLCPQCSKGWAIENVYDVVQRESSDWVKATDFIGKTLGELKEQYALKTDARYYVGTEPFMHNERFKDNSLKYPNPKDEWEKTRVKNDNGWVGTVDGITDEYIIQKDDIVVFQRIHYFHSDCNRIDLENEYTNSFKEIFTKAGFTKIEMKKIPNEYWGNSSPVPWFEITTEFGTFKIGWRKRVINIDWTKVRSIGNYDFLKLFDTEEVTKDHDSIHAYGDEKAVNYLSKIVNYLKK
jgi:hypothetical protein